MLLDAISRIEKSDIIENVALKYHFPSNGTYVIVDKDFNFKIISKERFSFNSKYVAMDFYSQIINLNKSVDKKKLITSNNYLSFFCKNFDKLTLEIIDNYYERLETPENCLTYRDWIKENIFKISNMVTKKEVVKIFFISDIENYIKVGRKYLRNNILSNITEIDGNLYGSSLFLNLNSKKPFLKTLTRKTDIPSLTDVEETLKYKYLSDILFSFAKRGYEVLYVLENGELIPINLKKGETPNRNFINGIIFAYKIDDRGNLVILDMDVVPKYTTHI